MEKKLATYANGFSLLVNKKSGEAIISFVQNQPAFNPETSILDLHGSAEVFTVVIPFALADELSVLIKDCIEKENAAEDKKE